MDTDGLAAAVTKQGSLVRQMKKVRGCWQHGQAFFRVLDCTYTAVCCVTKQRMSTNCSYIYECTPG